MPKLHKNLIINDMCKISGSTYINVTNPDDLTIRPILAGPTCETHRMSNLVDIFLKLYVSKVHSYIRDTVDFLNTFLEKINLESIVVSFDVTTCILKFHMILDLLPYNIGLTKFLIFYTTDFPKISF